MDRAKRRKNTFHKIKQRLELLKNLGRDKSFCKNFDNDVVKGKLENSSEVSARITGGCSKKTNRRKAHSNYRTKLGGYGKENNYSPHDQRQVDKANDF